MLVLARGKRDSVIIRDKATNAILAEVFVAKIRRKIVVLGIAADSKSIEINRHEVDEAKHGIRRQGCSVPSVTV